MGAKDDTRDPCVAGVLPSRHRTPRPKTTSPTRDPHTRDPLPPSLPPPGSDSRPRSLRDPFANTPSVDLSRGVPHPTFGFPFAGPWVVAPLLPVGSGLAGGSWTCESPGEGREGPPLETPVDAGFGCYLGDHLSTRGTPPGTRRPPNPQGGWLPGSRPRTLRVRRLRLPRPRGPWDSPPASRGLRDPYWRRLGLVDGLGLGRRRARALGGLPVAVVAVPGPGHEVHARKALPRGAPRPPIGPWGPSVPPRRRRVGPPASGPKAGTGGRGAWGLPRSEPEARRDVCPRTPPQRCERGWTWREQGTQVLLSLQSLLAPTQVLDGPVLLDPPHGQGPLLGLPLAVHSRPPPPCSPGRERPWPG